jgi:hypothetical protein
VVRGGWPVDPQQTDTAETQFSFASGSTKDRVTLEVWRGDRQVGEGEIDVALDEKRARNALAARPHTEIRITEIPPWQPGGGTNTRAQISGRIIGNRDPSDVLILYARADVWYRQPTPDAVIPIRPDGSWSSWTHTGGSYAALLARRDVEFFGRRAARSRRAGARADDRRRRQEIASTISRLTARRPSMSARFSFSNLPAYCTVKADAHVGRSSRR